MTDKIDAVEAVARAICSADDSMYHHERTDDYPCSACKADATVLVPILRAKFAEEGATAIEAEFATCPEPECDECTGGNTAAELRTTALACKRVHTNMFVDPATILALLDLLAEKDAVPDWTNCANGSPGACASYRCGSNCSNTYDRMHPCLACMSADYVEERNRTDAALAERDALRDRVAAVKAAMALGPECGHSLPVSQEYGTGKCRRQAGHDPKHTSQPQHSRWPDKPDTDAILAEFAEGGAK